MADNDNAQNDNNPAIKANDANDADVSLTPSIRQAINEEQQLKLQSIQDFLSKNVPAAQVEPAKSIEPVEPVESVEPAKSIEPVEPAKSIEPVESVEPVEPVEPVEQSAKNLPNQPKQSNRKSKSKQKPTKRRTLRQALPTQDERLPFPAIEAAAQTVPAVEVNTPPAVVEAISETPSLPKDSVSLETPSASVEDLPAEQIQPVSGVQRSVETAKAPQTVPTDAMQTAIKGMTSSKRKLIQRREDNAKKIEQLKKELETQEAELPIQMLQNAVNDELAKQEKLKQEIDAASEDIRRLRQKESEIRSSRAKTEADIAERRASLVKLQKIKADPDATPEDKQKATQDSIQLKDEISAYRELHAMEGADLAKLNENVQEKLKSKEDAQASMSQSKASARDFRSEMESRQTLQGQVEKAQTKDVSLRQDIQDYEQKRKERDADDAQRVSPAQYIRQASREAPVRGATAAQALGPSSTALERAAYKSATKELNDLVGAIRSAKDAMVDLEEGSEEYAEKQQEVSKLEKEAVEAAKKRLELEQKQQRKRDFEDSLIGRGARALQAGVSGAFNALNTAVSASSQGAIERYVTEEEKKSANIRLKAQEVYDLRNRYTDASSLLATGGGALFGAETPYAKGGGTSGAVKGLAKDYVDATRAMPGIELTTQIAGGLTNAALSGAIEGGKQFAAGDGIIDRTVSGAMGAFGTTAIESMKVGGRAVNTIASSPQLQEQLGAETATNYGKQAITGAADFLRDKKGTISDFIGKGVEDPQKRKETIETVDKAFDKIIEGSEQIANNVPNAIKRSIQQVQQQNALLQTQVESDQVGRIKERLDLAFQPQLQSYLDTLPMQRQVNRSLGFQTRQQREQTQLNVEGLSIDEELTRMGFSPDQVIQATGAAASAFGRHGRGAKGFDMMQRSVKSAAIAENLGMGDVTQSMAAMGKMLEGGVEDPQVAFKKALQDAIMLGLQDSRDFQGLLSAASDTAENTVGFKGSLDLIASAAGTGRAGDLETAKSYAEMVKRRTSGATGSYDDLIKHKYTQEAVQGVIATAEKQGLSLSDRARTRLLSMQHESPEALQNREYAEARLGPEDLAAVKAYEEKMRKQTGNKDFDFFKDFSQKVNTAAGMTGGIEYTQSQELVDIRNMLTADDIEPLRRKLGRHQGATKEEREKGDVYLKEAMADIIAGTSGMNAGQKNAPDMAIGAASALINAIEQKLGEKVAPEGSIVGKHRKERLTREQAAKAAEEAGLAGSTAEGQIGGAAGVAAEDRKQVLGAIYDPVTGKQRVFEPQEQEVAKNLSERQKLTDKVKASDTVRPDEDLRLSPLGQEIEKIISGFKDLGKALENFEMSEAVINVTNDVYINAKQKVQAAILDGTVGAATRAAGESVAQALGNAWDKIVGKNPSPQLPAKQEAKNKQTPPPTSTP